MNAFHFLRFVFPALAALSAVSVRAQAGSGMTNQIYVVPFSHLDLMWAGTLEECLSRGGRIIDKAIGIAERHPEFRFLLEDEDFVAGYVETHRGAPELAEFKRLVKEGRIEIAPKWAAIYQNLPRGEALARNLIYGKEYARDTFGVDPRVAHFGDVPGFTEQLPQLLAQADIPYMVMTRMGPRDCALFRYRAPNGSTALTWNTINGYGWGVGLGLHHAALGEADFAKIARSIHGVQAATRGPIYLGWGTDLFAPSENLIPNLTALNQKLAPMHFRFATPTDFFQAASEAGGAPEFTGEIPSGWGNIMTSMCALWPPAFRATDLLITAEKFAAINWALGYADYPQAEFEASWKQTLESMDHNNFGQGGEIGDRRKLEFDTLTAMRAGQILRDRLRNIAERVKRPFPRCTPIVVFNPSSWPRDDAVQAHVSVYGDVAPGDIADYRRAIRLVDAAGASIPFYLEQSYGTVSRAFEIIFVARDVPSLGYKTYFLTPAKAPEEFSNACQVKWQGPEKRILGDDQIENEFYQISADRATGSVTIFDKDLNRAVIRGMETVGAEERGGNSISVEPKTGRTLINSIGGVALEENNPTRAVLRIDGALGGVPIRQRLTLYRGLKRVDLEETLDWRGDKLVRIEQIFPYDHPGAKIQYGTPFGSVAGDDLFPNAGPRSGDEIPREQWQHERQIQNWIFAGDTNWGVTIAADHLPVTLEDGAIKAGMLRGTFSTTTITRQGRANLLIVPPAGKYVYRYTISSGRGGWTGSKSYRAGEDFSNPFIPVTAVNELSTKSLPPAESFLSIGADGLALAALKKAERGQSVVARLVEMEGRSGDVSLMFLGRQARLQPVDLLERPTRAGAGPAVRVGPRQILTVDLTGQF